MHIWKMKNHPLSRTAFRRLALCANLFTIAALLAAFSVLGWPNTLVRAATTPAPTPVTISLTRTFPPGVSAEMVGKMVWLNITVSPSSGGGTPAGSITVTSTGVGGLNCTLTLSSGQGRCFFIPQSTGPLVYNVAFTSSDTNFDSNNASFGIFPVDALSLTPQLSAGRKQTCYLNATGSLRCWGDSSTIPVDGSGNPVTVNTYSAVSAGGYHTCAIQQDGDLECWGEDPAVTSVPSGKFFAVSAGDEFACAINSNFKLQCWGTLSTALQSIPTGDFQAISAGSVHACGIERSSLNTNCWGDASGGKLSYSGQSLQVAVGVDHACAIVGGDSHLNCWGSINTAPAGTGYLSVDSGSSYSCARKSDSTLTCWGANAPGVDTSSAFTNMSAGFLHVCALKNKTGGGSYLACFSDPANNAFNQAPRLGLSPTSMTPYLAQNRAFTQVFTPSGGALNYTISHTAGTLPNGLTLNGTNVVTGTLSGSPTVLGGFNFTLTAAENFANSSLPLELAPKSVSYSTTVQDPATSVSIGLSPTSATAGTPVQVTVTVSKSGTPGLSGTVTISTDEVGSGCTVAVSGNTAQCSVAFDAAGTRTVYAEYDGDGFYNASSQNSTSIVISAATITPGLTAGNAYNLSLNGSGSLYGWGKNDSNQIAPLPNFVFSQVSAGESHACARRLSGALACWGWNGYGQANPPSGNNYVAVSAGEMHTCAVNYTGTVTCWGNSAGSRLNVPSATFAMETTALAAGANHTCALRSSDNFPLCWGALTTAPAKAFLKISSGSGYTCGIRSSDSMLECWGSGATTPPGVGTYTAVEAGQAHACAINQDNDLVCWGALPAGLPALVTGDFKALASGSDHTCALNTDNKVQCWGVNAHLQAPQLTFSPTSFATLDLGEAVNIPLVISGGRESLFSFTSLNSLMPPGLDVDDSSGVYNGTTTEAGVFTFPVTVTERTLSLGLIATQQFTQVVRSPVALSVQNLTYSEASPMQGRPVKVTVSIAETPGTRLTNLGLLPTGSVVVTSDDGAQCSAAISAGQGNCTLFFATSGAKNLSLSYPGDAYYMTGASASPYALTVQPYQKTLSLHTSSARTDAHLADGSLVCWGSACPGTPPALAARFDAGPSLDCRLEMDGSATCAPAAVSPPALQNFGFVALSVGWDHACAVRYDGTLLCWGDNTSGKATPLSGSYKAVSAGRLHTCAIKSDDTMACWGSLPGTTPSGTFKQVSAGDGHDCAVRSDDSLVCWGGNASGQTSAPSGSFKEVAVGAAHSCALKADNTMQCWGSNSVLQSTAPFGQFLTLAAFGDHTCALRNGPKLTCWGDNASGQAPRISITALTQTSLPAQQYFEHAFNPAGGLKPYSANISSGALPRGMSLGVNLSPAGVVLFGTPQTPNVYHFNLFWQDAGSIPLALELPYTLTITGAELGVDIQPSHPQGALWGLPLTLRYVLDNSTVLAVPTTRLTVTLPSGLSGMVYSGLSGCTLDGLTLVCPIDPFAGLGTQTLVVTGTVSVPLGSVITTTAAIQPTALNWPELAPADNQDSVSLGVAMTSLVLDDDFDTAPPSSGWSGGSVITTTTGISYLGDFTASDSLRLQFLNLPPHQRIHVSFDLYVIGGWTGNTLPGTWQFGQFGHSPLLTTTFCNVITCTQAFPQAFPGGNFAGLTSATANGELGLAPENDARYTLGFIFDHNASLLDLLFQSNSLPAGARWGVDNVKVWLDGGLSWLFMPMVVK